MNRRGTRVLGRLCVIVALVFLLFGGAATATAVAQSDRDETGSEGEIIYEEEFDYSGVESRPWECYNRPYNYRNVEYDRTSTKGFCNIGEGSAKVQEESARMRYFGRTLTLPETDGELVFEARARGSISARWSHSKLGIARDSEVRYLENEGSDKKQIEVISSSGGYPGSVTVTDWKTVTANITEYAGEEVRLAMYANGRWVFENQETTAWVEVDHIRIEKEVDEPTIEITDDGELYQAGRVTDVAGTVKAGANISVTGEIQEMTSEASDDIVYSSIGLSDGTVLDVGRIDGLGSGTITHTLSIPETANGDIVWTFHSATTEDEAIDEFNSDAEEGFVDGRGRNTSIVVGTVNGTTSGEGEEGLPGFTVVATLIALLSVAFVLRRRE